VRAEFFNADRQTDRHDLAFGNFENVPRNWKRLLRSHFPIPIYHQSESGSDVTPKHVSIATLETCFCDVNSVLHTKQV
jgi:hypothetical protein